MVLAALQSRAREAVSWPTRVLTVGNPAYKNPDLVPLVSSADECNSWADLFAPQGNGDVRLLVERDATERNVRESIAGRRLVHFAVHGVVDQQNDSVFAGSLALTPGRGADDEDDDDGYLNLGEIYELPLGNCELAVLSACDSNVGPNRKLEAGSTLTRAFLSAGASRVVSSLWMVNDESTAAMMKELAREIAGALERGERPNYAEALQQARRRVRRDKEHEEWRHPHFWAPFVLIGPPS
jgi:CHAT domain-containing protein